MSDDNIGRFFNAENFDDDDESKSESWKAVNRFGKELFRKSIDILNLTQTIVDILPDDDHAESTKGLLMQNAYLIPAKIRGAMGLEYYSMMMENAVIIKVNACELRTMLWNCSTLHGIDETYVDVIRNEIDEFKKIFIQWVNSFDKENDLPDEWHLFNDPTSFPEDDEPFDPNDFFDDSDDEK